MSDYAISCCSTADLSHEWYEKRDIAVVPFHIIVGKDDLEDDMGVTITQEELFRRMLSGEEAHSSQVSTDAYINHFEPMLKQGKDILHITLSSGISGTLNSAMAAKAELQEKYPYRKIIIVDSLNGSSGYGMVVDLAADLRDEGKTIDEVQDYLEAHLQEFNTWVLSTDLTFLIKGGRVKPAAGAIGKLLNICPFVTLTQTGSLAVVEKIRTKKKALARLVEIMKERADKGLSYEGKCFISHSDPALGQELKAQVEASFPQLKGKIATFLVGGTIGVHLGPGTVVLFFRGPEGQKRDFTA
ncbi:MAG: DegV family protein [Lachnospiraceae bacterium]|nr:DegV family protein [Lachnospiraceae bacterium]